MSLEKWINLPCNRIFRDLIHMEVYQVSETFLNLSWLRCGKVCANRCNITKKFRLKHIFWSLNTQASLQTQFVMLTIGDDDWNKGILYRKHIRSDRAIALNRKKKNGTNKKEKTCSHCYATEYTLWLIELTSIRWAIFIPQATESDFFVLHTYPTQ